MLEEILILVSKNETMRAIILMLTLLLLSCFSEDTSQNSEIEKQAIKSVMKMQEQAWSDGDIDAFMEGYWKSDSLVFIGRNGPTYGWNTTKENYKKGYPDKDAMGQLTFDVISLEPLCDDIYTMLGKYTLIREQDTPTGFFTLLWKKVNGNWVIISDHTSG